MATPTYVPLASITLASNSLQVSFSSISQSYRDLVIVCTGGVVARTGTAITFNGSASMSGLYLTGTGSTVTTGGFSGNSFSDVWENSTTNLTTSIIQIFDYSIDGREKHFLVRSGNAIPNGVEAYAIRSSDTAPITSIELTYSGSWAAGCTFVLYGIAG